MRSVFNIDQFKLVLQQLAHKIAVDAVAYRRSGRVRITLDGSDFSEVSTDKYCFRFYARHVSYSHQPAKHDWENILSFDAEEKHYQSSNHSTKISFFADDEKAEKQQKLVEQFIAKLMKDADLKPVPRFSLAEHQKKTS